MIKKVLVICLTAYFPVTANAETYAKITKITPNYTYSKSLQKRKVLLYGRHPNLWKSFE